MRGFVEPNKERAREMCKTGTHLVRFSVIISLSLMLCGSVLVSQDAQAGARSVCTWKQLDWSGMTSAEQGLWSRLGWSQARWDSNNPKMAASSDSKSWADLSEGERNAATQLGFNSRNWETTCASRASSTKVHRARPIRPSARRKPCCGSWARMPTPSWPSC